MKPIYIVGAGGAAKEIFFLIKEINTSKCTFDFKGFVDVNSLEDMVSIGDSRFPIYKESIFLNTCKENVSIVFGLGDSLVLKNLAEKYKQNSNFDFPNIIHPLVVLDSSVKLETGNIIASGCIFTVDISLQSFNYLNRGVHIGHDCVIGSYNILNPCAVISGGVVIKDGNLIGSNSTVLQYLTIDSKNKIGAGSVITKDVGSDTCMIGVPAKKYKIK